MSAPAAITVRGVSKRFKLPQTRQTSLRERFVGDRRSTGDFFWPLRDVDLTVPRGSMFALVGRNGSGKSTLLRLIAGIYRPTSGSIEVAGRISALLELGAGFHPELTGRENLYLQGSILGLRRRDVTAAANEIIEFSGIGDFIDVPVKLYSSGMGVRLAFSIAVQVKPDILIVDEVLSVGDEEFQQRCTDRINELRARNTTVLLVTHGLGLLTDLCDGAALLDAGSLVTSGTPDEVIVEYHRRLSQLGTER